MFWRFFWAITTLSTRRPILDVSTSTPPFFSGFFYRLLRLRLNHKCSQYLNTTALYVQPRPCIRKELLAKKVVKEISGRAPTSRDDNEVAVGGLELLGDGVEDDLFCIFEWAGQCEACGDFVASAAVGLCDFADIDVGLAAKGAAKLAVGKLYE